MNIRIKILITCFFLLPLLSLSSADLPGLNKAELISHFDTKIYYSQNLNAHELDILNMPDDAWSPLPASPSLSDFREKAPWLKISLPEGSLGQELYLTEHNGLGSWDVFFFSENLLLDRESINWHVYRDENRSSYIQYRGFSSFQIFNSNHKDVVLLIRMNPDMSSAYSFYLRGKLNFQRKYGSWIFIQGVGMGLILVLLILTLIRTIRLRHRIDFIFLILVIFAGLNISYVTGLGPQLLARFFPGISSTIWVLTLGLFNIFSINFIDEFSDLPRKYKITHDYFLMLKVLALGTLVMLPFISRYRIFLVLNLSAVMIFILILFGLIRLVTVKISQSRWLLSGWCLMSIVTITAYVLKKVLFDSQSIMVLSYILGQALLLIFLGSARIKRLDEQCRKESIRRQSAENVAASVLKRMGDQKRMADLGAMVGSVTHELGTPLGVAVTLSSNMTNTGRTINQLFRENELSEDDFKIFLADILESSELIEKNMENARTLMEGFKQVAADQAAPDLRELNLNQYVGQVIRILKTQIKKTPYILEQSIDHNLWLTTIPGILTQILTNLVNNAVTHGFSQIKEGRILISGESFEQEGKPFVKIQVKDDGNGISPDILDKVFDIYFTTRKGLGGTGIGLSIVKSLLEERLNGTISLESELGKGSTFTIILPKNLKDIQ